MVLTVSVQRRLEAVPVLRALPPPVLARLAGAAVERVLARGVPAYLAGDQAEHLFAVSSGTVKLSHVTQAGRETVDALVGAGEVFGEAAESVRSHDAWAVEPCRVLTMPLAILKGDPAHAALLQARLDRTARTLHAMMVGDTHSRTAARLVDLMDRHGRPVPHGTMLGVRLTQDDLARMTGASRETTNKVLASFRRRGWLRRDGDRLVITDPTSLRERSGSSG